MDGGRMDMWVNGYVGEWPASGKFVAGQFGVDNSARTIRSDNSSSTIRRKVYILNFIQNPSSTQKYSFHQSRFHFSNFSSIPHSFRQHFSSILIPNSYCLDRNGPNNRIYNPIYRYSYTL